MIHGIMDGWQLLATLDTDGIGGHFDRLPNTHELLILGSVTLLVIITIAWQAISRWRHRDFEYNSPPRLFADLCRAHKLNRSNRRLLKQLAAARGLKMAAMLFVEPDYFDMTNVPPALKPAANDLRQLRHKLFD
jgi:hypothetical protein